MLQYDIRTRACMQSVLFVYYTLEPRWVFQQDKTKALKRYTGDHVLQTNVRSHSRDISCDV